MKNISPCIQNLSFTILGLSSAELFEFLLWLHECCGITVSNLLGLSISRQNEVYEEYLIARSSDDD